MTKSVKVKDDAMPVGTATQNFFRKYGKAATSSSIIGELLKFTKFGEYRAGRDEEEIGYGTRLAAHMDSLCVGYQHWEDGRVTEKVMGPVGQGFVPPRRSELGDTDKAAWENFDDGQPRDPWQFTTSIVLVDPRTKATYTFSTSSKGGLDAIGQLALKYGESMRQKPGEMPIVELGGSSYKHPNKKYGEIRIPILKVVDWIPLKDLPPLDNVQGSLQLEPPSGGEAKTF